MFDLDPLLMDWNPAPLEAAFGLNVPPKTDEASFTLLFVDEKIDSYNLSPAGLVVDLIWFGITIFILSYLLVPRVVLCCMVLIFCYN